MLVSVGGDFTEFTVDKGIIDESSITNRISNLTVEISAIVVIQEVFTDDTNLTTFAGNKWWNDFRDFRLLVISETLIDSVPISAIQSIIEINMTIKSRTLLSRRYRTTLKY